MTHASAPGKIILFGEHAVVYGRSALAVPVTQVHADAEVVDSPRAGIWIHAPDISLHAELSSLSSDHPIASVIHNFFFAFGVSPFPSLDISITSSIPVASGLGSGAAVTVALLRALSSAVHRLLSNEQINQFAYEIEKQHRHHVCPSRLFHQRPADRDIHRRVPLHPRHRGYGHLCPDQRICGRCP
jgi:mevalonate kinase